MKKILSHIAKKYRSVVHNVRMRSADKTWAKRLTAAIAEFPLDFNSKTAAIVLKTQIDYLRMDGASQGLDSYERLKTADKMAHAHFEVAVSTLKHFLPIGEIVGIQPMQGPVSLAYTLQYEYSEPTQVVDTVDFLTAHPQRHFKLSVMKGAVEASCSRLKSQWPLEPIVGLAASYGDNIEEEMCDVLGSEIAYETVTKIIADLKALAAQRDVWDGATTGLTPEHLMLRINQMANQIAQRTRRGAGNFIIASPMVIAYLQTAARVSFTPSTDEQKAKYYHGVLKHVGVLHGTINVWCNPYSSDTEILIGYKGTSGAIDTGYIHCPYVPIMPTGIMIDPVTVMPVVRYMTRAGTYTFKPATSVEFTSDSAGYYGVLDVKGLTFENMFVDEETTLV